MSDHLLTWAADGRPRWEQARVEVGLGRLRARGTALVGGDQPYRVDYELDTVAGLVTRRLLVRVAGLGFSRELLLTRDQDGEWAARRTAEPGRDAADLPRHRGHHAPQETTLLDTSDLDGALDCDLAMSPLTNTMPVLRHVLHRRAGRHQFVMAYVTLPGLAVVAAHQTYEHVRAGGVAGPNVRDTGPADSPAGPPDDASDKAPANDTANDTANGAENGAKNGARNGARNGTENGGGVVRYSSGGFEAEITFDADCFVTAYPKVANRA